MKLHHDWRKILTRAWSARLMCLAVALEGAESALPYFEDLIPVPRGVFGTLSGVVTIAAIWARVTIQKNV